MTKTPLCNDDGYVPRDMTDEEAVEVAEELYSIFVDEMGGL